MPNAFSAWESSGGALEGDGSGAGGVGGAGAREGEAGGGGGGAGGEGWAQFDAPAHDDHFWPYTQQNTSHDDIEENMRNLQLENDFSRLEGSSVELANKLLTAMSSMPPHLLASLVSPASPAPVTPPVPDDKLDPFEDDFVAKETPAIVEEATTEQKTDPPSIDGSKSEEKSPEPRKETEPSEDPAQRAEETIPETPSVDAPLENCSAPATECSDDRR
ncbi:unnamed protein product [Diatraea saccharalis]|uniref:Uncharacterized protein n=1 Tax=Diatraea saccharalis TaxID=40085 RepID=A0A9N9WD17_9NEOP|nr:unnamed protein product [Diatraea saccharalis]